MLPSAVDVCGDSDPWDFLVLKLCERCTNPRRTQVLIFLEQLLRALNVAEVFTFGSVPLRTCLPDADVDVSVFLPPSCAHPAPFFSLLHSHLNNLAVHSQLPKTNNSPIPFSPHTIYPLPPPLSLSGENSSNSTTSSPAISQPNSIPLTSRSDSVLVMGQRGVGSVVNSPRAHNANSTDFGVRDVVYVGNADVPVMKCSVHGVALDITANQLGGVCSLNLFEQIDRLVGQHHLFKRSVLLIKSFLHYETRLMGSHHRLLSSYTLNTLVLFLFNVFHARISHPRVALILFCAVFAEFNWNEFGLTIFGRFALNRLPEMQIQQASTGETLIKQSDLEPFTEAFSTLVTASGGTIEDKVFPARTMNVVDCLQPHNNLGRSMSPANTLRFCRALKLAAATLFSIHLPHLSVTPPLALKHTASTPQTNLGAHEEGDQGSVNLYPHAESQGSLILGAFSNTLSHLGMFASPLTWPALRRVKDVQEVVQEQQQKQQQHPHEGWMWADWISSSMVIAIIMAEPTSTEKARGFTQKFDFSAKSSREAEVAPETDRSGSTREKGKPGADDHALNDLPSPTSTITPPVLPSLPTLCLSSRQTAANNETPCSPALQPVNLSDLSRALPEQNYPPNQQKQIPHMHSHHHNNKYSSYQPTPQATYSSYPYANPSYPDQHPPASKHHHVAMPGEDSDSDDDSENADNHSDCCENTNNENDHEKVGNSKSEQGLETSEAMVDRSGVLKGDLKGIASAMQAIHRWAKAKRDHTSSLATMDTCSNTSNTSAASHNTSNTGGGVAPPYPQTGGGGIAPNQHHGIGSFAPGMPQHHELNPVFGYHGLSGNVGVGMPVSMPQPEYAHMIVQPTGSEFPALPSTHAMPQHPRPHPANMITGLPRAMPQHPQSQQSIHYSLHQPQPQAQPQPPLQAQPQFQPQSQPQQTQPPPQQQQQQQQPHGLQKTLAVSGAPKQILTRPLAPNDPALSQHPFQGANANPPQSAFAPNPVHGMPATANLNQSAPSTPRQQQTQQRPVDAWMLERRGTATSEAALAQVPSTPAGPAQVTWSNRPSSVVRPAPQPVQPTVVKKPPVNSSNNRRPGSRRAPDSGGNSMPSPRYGKRQDKAAGDEDWPTLSTKQSRGRSKPKM